MIDFVIKNKEWLFSGVGVVVIATIFGFVNRIQKRPKLMLTVQRANIRCNIEGEYDLQIDFLFMARNGRIYLKKIKFGHRLPVFGPYEVKKYRFINKLVINYADDALSYAPSDLEKNAKKLIKSGLDVADFCIEIGDYRTFTLIERIESERLPDQWKELPLTGWKVIVDYNDNRQIEVPFDFTKHPSSEDGAFIEWHI